MEVNIFYCTMYTTACTFSFGLLLVTKIIFIFAANYKKATVIIN